MAPPPTALGRPRSRHTHPTDGVRCDPNHMLHGRHGVTLKAVQPQGHFHDTARSHSATAGPSGGFGLPRPRRSSQPCPARHLNRDGAVSFHDRRLSDHSDDVGPALLAGPTPFGKRARQTGRTPRFHLSGVNQGLWIQCPAMLHSDTIDATGVSTRPWSVLDLWKSCIVVCAAGAARCGPFYPGHAVSEIATGLATSARAGVGGRMPFFATTRCSRECL